MESFKIFSYVDVDRKYQRYIPFIQTIFCICINNLNGIINNLDVISDKNISLYNNITESLLLEDWISSQHNYTLIAVVALSMLYYAQSKRSNIVQRVNIQFVFTNNISK